jgi:transposase
MAEQRYAMIDKILPGVAGIDIGSEYYFVAVANQEVRRFTTYTGDIRLLTEYLREQGVVRVAMEATGVYWIPLHDHLDTNGFEVTVFNGAHARNLPGRKSDVQDCQWHAMLHSYGLLKSCFIPSPTIRQLRTYHRLRASHLESSSSCAQEMQKYLELLNVRFHKVISQVHGVSGLRMIDAILEGERDPRRLVELCDTQIKKSKREEVIASLEGTWEEHHLFGLRQALEGYRFFQNQMARCDREMERLLQDWNQGKPPGTPKTNKKSRHNPHSIEDLHSEVVPVCNGIDATVLPGISPSTVLKLIAEIGTDLSRWPTEKHFTAWLGLAPKRNESGKRRRRVKRQKTVAGQIFKLCVLGIARTKDSALGAFYHRMSGTKGVAVANTATARKLAEMYYRLMTKGVDYVEEGLEKYEAHYRDQSIKRLHKLAKKFGFTITEIAEPATA